MIVRCQFPKRGELPPLKFTWYDHLNEREVETDKAALKKATPEVNKAAAQALVKMEAQPKLPPRRAMARRRTC